MISWSAHDRKRNPLNSLGSRNRDEVTALSVFSIFARRLSKVWFCEPAIARRNITEPPLPPYKIYPVDEKGYIGRFRCLLLYKIYNVYKPIIPLSAFISELLRKTTGLKVKVCFPELTHPTLVVEKLEKERKHWRGSTAKLNKKATWRSMRTLSFRTLP